MAANDPIPAPQGSEARRRHRARTLKAAQILINGKSSIDCLIKDLNDTGARLRLPSALHVPDAFTLSITGDGTKRPAEVVWRRVSELGVCFTG